MAPLVTPLGQSGSLARKMLWYGAAAGLTGLAAAGADAQIVYHDVNPDVTLNDTDLDVDFDSDGDPELTLFGQSDPQTLFATETLLGADNVNAFIGNGVSGYNYALPLAAGVAVSAANPNFRLLTAGSLAGQASFTYASSDPNGWVGAGDKYLGVRFVLGANQHFGWVRLSITAPGIMVVRDYAYNATPNTAINTGQGATTAVEPGALAEGYLFSELAPNPVASRSTFNLAVGRAEHVRVDVLDVSGRQVATVLDQTIPGNELRRVEFDASALPSGVYVMRVTGETFVTTRRVTVAH